jgi:hypothetical protein
MGASAELWLAGFLRPISAPHKLLCAIGIIRGSALRITHQLNRLNPTRGSLRIGFSDAPHHKVGLIHVARYVSQPVKLMPPSTHQTIEPTND